MSALTLKQLTNKIKAGEIDSVIVAFPDVVGRLIGKRFTGEFFLQKVAEHGTHGCNYLLTVNIEMEPMDGFRLANWEKGFGDFEWRPDFSTLRLVPWQAASALVLCDLHHHGGQLVEEAPRAVLRKQLERIANKNLTCNIASELEFFLFKTSYHDAFAANYQNLPASSHYRIDYHTMQPAEDEALFRQVRNQMLAAGVAVESSKGEWGRGQHEINFAYAEPLAMADMHVVFKQGVKEIFAQHGRAVSFMPKYSTTEPGNSCHIHASIGRDGANCFWDARRAGGSKFFRQFLGGLIQYSRELSYFFAPTINAYKRYQSASWAPTKLAWSTDNRTVGFRVVGRGDSLRIENRMPGGDANPYLAFAATLVAGMKGVEERLDCGEEYHGNAYADPSLPSLPKTLRAAADLLAQSGLARDAFGPEVIEFYVHTARLEVEAFDNAVTDWERQRYFERI
ncbi:MAG: glutamine synthetase family protein [Verrucomicrobiota bacterium]|nr:glutamine synthetase family protein [Verrucomicrobiota bacterium]